MIIKPGRRAAIFAGLCLFAFAPPALAQDFNPAQPPAAVVQKPLGKAQRALILAALQQAPSHGLAAYDVDEGSTDEALARAVIDYARVLHGGRMEGKFTGDWHLRPPPYDAQAAFQQVAGNKKKLRNWLDRLAPQYEGYGQLQQALVRYEEIEATGGWKAIKAPKKALKVGSKDAVVMALRERLGVEYPGPTPEANPSVFDAALSEHLKGEQARLGVPVTGLLDKATVAALNVPVSDRIATIKMNLERWRWMPPSLPSYRVEMNLPAQWLEVRRGGEVPLAMKAVVGKPTTPTPMFQDVMSSLVFNPPWNVPDFIAQRDILPKAQKDKAYLVKNDYVVQDGRVIQMAGPKSALGKVKFDLNNPFAIYFHDTPNRALFEADQRTFSNGCMRLEKAQELAEFVLEGDRYWHGGGIEKTLVSGETVGTELKKPVPVFVVYRTAFVQDGRVQFRNDIYGWDAKLRDILGG